MQEIIYLDNAATTWPKPPSVLRRVNRCFKEACGNPGRSAHLLSMRAAEEVYHARCALNRFFGGNSEQNVIFFPNATASLNTVIRGVLSAGDHVITTNIEHNSVLRPLYALRRDGVTYDIVDVVGATDSQIIERVSARIRRNTRMVIVNHVSNVTGRVMPLQLIAALCCQRGILFCVDASQSAGVYPLDMKNDGFDYLCCAGHKSLFGIQGSGLAVIRDGAPIPRPLMQGGNGVCSLELQMPSGLPEMLEAGTVNVPAIVSLHAGVSYIERHGRERLYSEIQHLSAPILSDFRELEREGQLRLFLDGTQGGSVISFAVRGQSPAQTAEALEAYGICVRSGFHCAPLIHQALGCEDGGTVRISFSAMNTMHDVEVFLTALHAIL